MREDNLIATIFAPLAGEPGVRFDDDCAHVPAAYLAKGAVVTMDTLVAGVHFFADDAPDLVAKKALRVNLSDLAAKAARPLGYLLSLALPKNHDAAWVRQFAAGLAGDQAEYDFALWGGDTVATPGPLTVTITAIGEPAVPGGLLRSGARIGDVIFVTGTIGDGALGLKVVTKTRFRDTLEAQDVSMLADRYHLPRPRLGFLEPIVDHITAAMDVSDGLALDLSRLARASGCAARLKAATVPLSPAGRRAVDSDPSLLNIVLSGGDDYEILFTAPPSAASAIVAHGSATGCSATAIGTMDDGEGLHIVDAEGRPITLENAGYQHL